MIEFLRKINRYFVYAAAGISLVFSFLYEIIRITGATAYSSGISFAALLVLVLLFSAIIASFVVKFLVYVFYRIDGAIFLRRCGLLFPFPIGVTDFEVTVFAYLIPYFLLCGLLSIPVFFFPGLSFVFGAIRTVLFWGDLALIIKHFLKYYSSDYDKRTLAFSLIIIPICLVAVSAGLAFMEVIR